MSSNEADVAPGWEDTVDGMVLREQEVTSDTMQFSESEKQAKDLDALDAAGDAVSSFSDDNGAESGDDVEYDPGAAINLTDQEVSEDGQDEDGQDEEEEGEEEEGEEEVDDDDGEEDDEEAGEENEHDRKMEDEEQADGQRQTTDYGESAGYVTASSGGKAQAKKPKAVGGFLVGDSDSEDDDGEDYDPAQLTTDGYDPQPPTNNVPMPSTANDDVYEPSHEPQKAHNGPPKGSPVVAVSQQDPPPAALAAPTNISALESRIADDPYGAIDSWLTLINDHRQNNHFDDARSVFNRFLELFPQAAEIWVEYIEMELELENFAAAEALFGKSLTKVVSVPLWLVYLDYVRRRNNLNDVGSEARTVVSRAYEFVLDNIGIDRESGGIWQDYVQFIRSGPGTIGGSGWQDQQKMDQLRKAFRRATSVPISNVNQLWKEYDQFEMGLNKITGRKFLAERSPAYMSAKSANTALDNLTRGLSRSTVPRLPPVAGFEGYQEYMAQVDIWRKWIAWEKSDPLDLQLDEPEVLKARILYCYKQALMPLRFWPELWVEAAEWCFENNVKENNAEKGLDLLTEGTVANPESILLAFKHADRLEITYPVEEGDDAKVARGLAVRKPYDKVIQTLRDRHKSLQEREKAEVARIEESAAPTSKLHESKKDDDDDDDGDIGDSQAAAEKIQRDQKIALIKQGFAAQMDLVSKCLTHVWIALARAMRRIQGKGSPQGPLGGLRQVFAEARKGGRLKSDIYVAVAKMEWKCYNDKAGGKILERGAKLFPEDPYFMIEYIKYLTAHGDNTNSRVVFETCVNKLAQKPETVHKAKPLLAYMHKREAEYGDLTRVTELEKRMAELYPNDPKLALFSKRFATEKFDPVGARIIISPSAQLRPRLILPSIEKQPRSARNSPMPGHLRGASPRVQLLSVGGGTNSPKRPYADDYDDANGSSFNPPRKILRAGDQREFQRGESPLKGAAGRRLDQQRRLQGHSATGTGSAGHGSYSGHSTAGSTLSLPTMVTFLLGQIPPAHQYNGFRCSAPALVHLLRETHIDPNAAYDVSRRAGGGSRPYATAGGSGRSLHARQVSSADYHSNRNSPGPSGARSISGNYQPSSLRPDSQDLSEPPPTMGVSYDWQQQQQGGYRY